MEYRAGDKRSKIGSLGLENWRQSGQTGDTAGVGRGLSDTCCWVENCKQPKNVVCLQEARGGRQVRGERQPAQEQGRASS